MVDFKQMRYYDLPRHWTKRIEPHLGDWYLNAILVHDFEKFTRGWFGKPFTHGQYPRDFEQRDWDRWHRGKEPRYWRFVKADACHWLVNFNLRLANLVEPGRPWRIIAGPAHSTVWDGRHTLFEFNFMAMGIAPCVCFAMAKTDGGIELPGGMYRYVEVADPPDQILKRVVEKLRAHYGVSAAPSVARSPQPSS